MGVIDLKILESAQDNKQFIIALSSASRDMSAAKTVTAKRISDICEAINNAVDEAIQEHSNADVLSYINEFLIDSRFASAEIKKLADSLDKAQIAALELRERIGKDLV